MLLVQSVLINYITRRVAMQFNERLRLWQPSGIFLCSTVIIFICFTLCWKTRNSSGCEIANVNFLRRHRTRTTAHNKVHFAYGNHTCL